MGKFSAENRQLSDLASGGATGTNAANIADATAIAAAAAVPATAGAVAVAGHGANTILANATAGTGSDVDFAVGTDSIPGRAGSANISNIPMTAAGRAVAGAASATAQTALFDLATVGAKGLGPPRSGAAGSYLDVTGNYSIPPGTSGGTVSALSGDVTGSGSGTIATTLAHIPFTPLQTALAAASAAIDFNGQQLTGVANPTTATGVANKQYVDALIAGLAWKQPVLCASTTNVVLSTGAQNGSVIDNVALTTGSRFALLFQTTASENGIYTANASGAPTRATDADSGVEIVSCAFFVEQGTVNADRAFVCTNDAITLGTTGITFVPFASVVGALIAANNLSDLTNVATARTNLGLAAIAASGSATDLIAGTISTARLPTSGATAGTYGDATHVSTVTVDTLGRITAVVQTAILISASSVTGLAAVATSGSASDLGTGTLPAGRLPASGVAAGTYGDASHSAVVTLDATGRATSASQTAIAIAAGSVSGLSTVQTGALTGDVTKPAGSGTTTLANIPNDTTMAGDLLVTQSAAPASPTTGKARTWVDSTSKVWAIKNDGGIVSHTVQTQSAVTHQFVKSIADDGAVATGQPDFADLSGSLQTSQIQGFPALTILANPTGSSAVPSPQNAAAIRTLLGLDAPRQFDLVMTYGIGDGTNADSVIVTSPFIGPTVFWMSPSMRAGDVISGYAGGAVDANRVFAAILELIPNASFGHVEMMAYCYRWDPQNASGTPVVNLFATKSGVGIDSPFCTVGISGTGPFNSGVQPIGWGTTDGLGVVMFPNSVIGVAGTAHIRFTLHVRLTP